MKYDRYQENTGNGIMSAYGTIEVGDVGTGMLAPFTASTSPTANHNTMMKTGGLKKSSSKKSVKSPSKKSSSKKSVKSPSKKSSSKKSVKSPSKKSSSKKSVKSPSKKITKGGDGIPYISDTPVTSVQNTLNGAITGFSNFMEKLDSSYLSSVNTLKHIKIGSHRLIDNKRGGKKSKNSKTSKKQNGGFDGSDLASEGSENAPNNYWGDDGKKWFKQFSKTGGKKSKKQKGGFDGSDWATSLASRGPANAPDNYWGVDGEKWFRQFNKTGEYIPNSQLAYAATPELAGQNECGVVSAYDERIINGGVSDNF